MMTLQQVFEYARDRAADIFKETGEILPLWHAVLGNGENALIATPWTNDEEKDATVRELKRFFADQGVRRYVFVCEAWVAEVKEWDGTRASEHPDRREVVRIHAEDRSGKVVSGCFYILRPEHGPPKLSPFKLDDHTGHTGRLIGLLT